MGNKNSNIAAKPQLKRDKTISHKERKENVGATGGRRESRKHATLNLRERRRFLRIVQ
jgi:hypothetical protein